MIAAQFVASGVKLPRAVAQAAKEAARAEAHYQEVKASLYHARGKATQAWEKDAKAHGLREALAKDPADFEPYPVSPPDTEAASAKEKAYDLARKARGLEFDAIATYEVLFPPIAEAWSQIVDWEAHVSPSEVTLEKARKFQAKADKLRSILLNLSLGLAFRDLTNREEEKAFRRAQGEAGRPVDLRIFRSERDQKRAGGRAA